ncbi:26S proteasome regulatory subunit 4 [Hondaea fermentalgiana]|uniref:26S proteasome regulatory subunit 4 n=1 Tax=Hondaea fermentalgiana TaxID=2315210 RepID=A0A2R5GZC6_9STRA|nr:26S proteasome regulatory subunit 4 [Hondaea fermentalgiana]|eukprot:GBG34113.1 26S proteasome regulatory subunit 4 [Hondaea fermentalgiana]
MVDDDDDDDDFNNKSDPFKPAKAKQHQHQDETSYCEDGDSENMEETRTPRRLPADVMQSLLLRASASAEREQSALHVNADQSLSWDIGSKPLVGWAQNGIDDGLRGLLVRSELCRGTDESAEVAQALAGALARRQGLGTLEISSHSLNDTLVRLEASSSNLCVLDPGTPNDQEDNQAIDQVLALLAKQQDPFNAGKAIKRALADQQNDGPNASAQGNGADGLPPEYLEEPRLRGLDPALIERIESEVLQQGDPVTFDDIAGLRFAKENIEEIVVWPLRNPEYYTGLRQLPKGLLLFGPPGTGKTLIGKAIAHEVSATFFSISASSLTSKWIGEGEKTVRALFGVAAVKQPSVVFIDEVDSLLTQRTSDENEASRRIKTEFLVQLDGAATSAGERVLVIGATNRPQELDEAARRRFIKRLYIPLPDDVTRTALLRKLLSKNEHSLTQDDIVSLCAQTDGYSGADVTNLAREASMGPLRDKMRHRRQIEDANTGAVSDKLRPICYQDFQVALRSIRASVSQDDLRFYIRWNEEFGTQEYAAPESAAGASSSSSSSALSSSS